MRIHFIAIGGSAMHNLALALHDGGHWVSGSDDQILEPSRSRLQAAGLLPETDGWHPEGITTALDAIVLGMHARKDNPELLAAQALGIPIYSYPAFLFQATASKRRIVVGGSHGKTTITSMLLHALKHNGRRGDFMVGAQLPGFDRMVHLDASSEFAVFEGDEYLSSPLDDRPKFFHYQPHLTLISGIAWDHINVFPTEEAYVEVFDRYLTTLAPDAQVVWCAEDQALADVVSRQTRSDLTFLPYSTPAYEVFADGTTEIHWPDGTRARTPLIGIHNLQNMAGARALATAMGVEPEDFDAAMADFTGAARRLESWDSGDNFDVFRDFAHAPSKVRATVAGVRASQPHRTLVAYFELHTFSSLNRDFLPTYQGALDAAHRAVVYFDPQVLAQKRMPELDAAFVRSCFAYPHLEIVNDAQILQAMWDQERRENTTLLLMSSGWFGGAQWNR